MLKLYFDKNTLEFKNKQQQIFQSALFSFSFYLLNVQNFKINLDKVAYKCIYK